MGSKILKFVFENLNSHLNAGMGIPWAGQTKANFDPREVSRALSFILTFGAAVPMGSISKIIIQFF